MIKRKEMRRMRKMKKSNKKSREREREKTLLYSCCITILGFVYHLQSILCSTYNLFIAM